jgi:hypothetical protein
MFFHSTFLPASKCNQSLVLGKGSHDDTNILFVFDRLVKFHKVSFINQEIKIQTQHEFLTQLTPILIGETHTSIVAFYPNSHIVFMNKVPPFEKKHEIVFPFKNIDDSSSNDDAFISAFESDPLLADFSDCRRIPYSNLQFCSNPSSDFLLISS